MGGNSLPFKLAPKFVNDIKAFQSIPKIARDEQDKD